VVYDNLALKKLFKAKKNIRSPGNLRKNPKIIYIYLTGSLGLKQKLNLLFPLHVCVSGNPIVHVLGGSIRNEGMNWGWLANERTYLYYIETRFLSSLFNLSKACYY